MLKLFIIYFCFLGSLLNNAVKCQTIYQQQNDPAVWGGACQTGRQQSPIKINERQTVYKASLVRDLVLNDYDKTVGTVPIFNDGKSIQATITPANGFNPTATFNSVTYNLVQFHFHWGGSEHTFRDRTGDGEIHLVHSIAPGNPNLLVLGAILKKARSSNNQISQIFRASVPALREYQSRIEYNLNSSLRTLLANIDMTRFFNYNGSLTTPDCAEGVNWIVYRQFIEVDGEAIEGLKTIMDNRGSQLRYNNREVQPLNNRTVFRSFKTSILNSLPLIP